MSDSKEEISFGLSSGNPKPFDCRDNLRPPWKKGQSGNPKGMSKKVAKLQVKNGAIATKIRNKLLKRVEQHLDDNPDAMPNPVTLKLIADSENRAYGAPNQPVSGADGGALKVEEINADARTLASSIASLASRMGTDEDPEGHASGDTGSADVDVEGLVGETGTAST